VPTKELPILDQYDPVHEMQTWLSKPSKLNCKSWGLKAMITCPGAHDQHGEKLPICAVCYADERGNYMYPSVIKRRQFNQQDWKTKGWESRMISLLAEESYFRWFDGGDLYHPELARKIYHIMSMTPWVHHWINTKSYRQPKIIPWINRMEELENVSLRRSSSSCEGGFVPGIHGATQIRADQKTPRGVFRCPARKQDNKCGDCYACFDHRVKVVAYELH
jgi:hypothetical protein